MRQHVKFKALLAVAVVALAATVAAGCGGGGHAASQDKGNDVDRAFVRLMVPHHQSAIEMANVAQRKGRHKQIKTLAINITTTQKAEIDQLNGIGDDIGAKADSSMSGMDHGGGHAMGDTKDLEMLGLSQSAAGMSMDMAALENAKPFDRAFIDMMVPHHQGAVRMAKAELANGKNPELKMIAQKIVDAQEKEIEEMSSWRINWYGGGVPSSG